jgi:DNA transposition AAA+ family ATPase
MKNAATSEQTGGGDNRLQESKMTETQTQINTVAPLANVARLSKLVLTCQNRKDGLPGMGCFYGPAGFGKTTAGVFVINQLGVCHVEALPFGGAKKLLEMIVTELGLQPTRTVSTLFDQAAHALAMTNRPLIIDEADQILTDRMIETVRHLHDKTLVPVILMGEELLPQKLRRWERVNGRILEWVAAEPATLQDLGFLAPIYAQGVTISDPLKAQLLAASSGSIRNVSTNLANLAAFAAVKGLTSVGLPEWAGQRFHTGQAPEARRGLGALQTKTVRGGAA